MPKLQLGVLISGRGSNMKAIIEACQSGVLEATVKVVISSHKQAKGLEIADGYGITTFGLDINSYANRDEYEQEIVTILKGHGVEWVALAGYMRLIGNPLLSAYEHKMVNIHPSLLPAFKGLNAQKQALNYGAKVTGCTVHFVDQHLDNGPIILQKAVPVLEDDTVDTLSNRILEQEHMLYPKALQLIAEHKIQVQDRRVKIVEDV